MTTLMPETLWTPDELRKLSAEISNPGHAVRTRLDAAADAWNAQVERIANGIAGLGEENADLRLRLAEAERALRITTGALSVGLHLAEWIRDRHAADGRYFDPGLIDKRQRIEMAMSIGDAALAHDKEQP